MAPMTDAMKAKLKAGREAKKAAAVKREAGRHAALSDKCFGLSQMMAQADKLTPTARKALNKDVADALAAAAKALK